MKFNRVWVFDLDNTLHNASPHNKIPGNCADQPREDYIRGYDFRVHEPKADGGRHTCAKKEGGDEIKCRGERDRFRRSEHARRHNCGERVRGS